MFAVVRNWLSNEINWPPGQQEVAVIVMPLLAVALPFAARDVLLTNSAASWIYAAFATVFALVWVSVCFAAVVRAKEAFYQKHGRPLLTKDYRDG